MKKEVNEIYFIRSIACLSVVMIHVVTMLLTNYKLSDTSTTAVESFQMLLLFGTPMFILISEYLLSFSYPNKLPQGFYKKRIKFIGLPYIFMAIFYAIFYLWEAGNIHLRGVVDLSFRHIFLAKWHGYFVIIIFQFYLLHAIFIKFTKSFSAIWLLLVGFIINVSYLYLFSYVKPPDIPYASDIWYGYSRLFFPGWIFYFTVAYFAGKKYQKLLRLLRKRSFILFVTLLLSIGYVLYNFVFGDVTMIMSRRIDILFYTTLLFFVLFLLTSYISKVSNVVMLISRYSFAIYLLHPFIQRLLNHTVSGTLNMGVYTLYLFLGSVIGSIFASFIINKIPFGKFIIGNIKPVKAKQANEKIHSFGA